MVSAVCSAILEEYVSEWFKKDVKSPYMSFVIPFHQEKKGAIPAVYHFDGTGRLQTVSKKTNEWFYSFLSKWNEVTGVPILLNTSFNDQEPIVETPKHAIQCFLGTNIDYLYFYEYNLLLKRS